MRPARRTRLYELCRVLEESPRTYEDIMTLFSGTGFLYGSESQLDGDRMVLQEKGFIDVEGRDFHRIILDHPVTIGELVEAFPWVPVKVERVEEIEEEELREEFH